MGTNGLQTIAKKQLKHGGLIGLITIQCNCGEYIVDGQPWCAWCGTLNEESLYCPRTLRQEVVYQGENMRQASLRLGGSDDVVRNRIQKGWSIDDAFNKPLTRHYVE